MRASLDFLTAEEIAATAVACDWTHTSVLSGDCSQNSKRTGCVPMSCVLPSTANKEVLACLLTGKCLGPLFCHLDGRYELANTVSYL